MTPEVTVALSGEGLSDLTLERPTYVVRRQDEPIFGERLREVTEASSILIDGSVPVHDRKRTMGGRLEVECKGDDQTAVDAARDALTAFLDLFEFELEVTVGGSSEARRCWGAEYRAPQNWPGFFFGSVVVSATFRVDPNPLA